MASIIKLAIKVILEVNYPRIWVPTTQFQKLNKYFKIQFSGNWIKSLISREQAWLTDSFPTF